MDYTNPYVLTAISGLSLLGLLLALFAKRKRDRRNALLRLRNAPNDVIERPPVIPHLNQPVLSARHLSFITKVSGDREIILKNASLDLYPGEITCIVGENGSGKSTLMELLALSERSTSGSLTIGGQLTTDLPRNSLDDVRARCIHYIPQEGRGLLGGSPIENITYLLHRLDGVELDRARIIAVHSLRRTGLEERYFDRRLSKHRFSGGELARIATACALARSRPVCLADEILRDLDDVSLRLILGLFRDLAHHSNTSVTLIAHQLSMEQRAEYFDRTLIIGGRDPLQNTQPIQ